MATLNIPKTRRSFRGRNPEAGQGITEYIIIVIVVAVVVLLGVRYFGSSVGNQFSDATEEITGLGEKRATEDTSVGDETKGSRVSKGGSTTSEGGGGESSEGGGEGGGSEPKNEIDALRARSVGDDGSSMMPNLSWGQILPIGGLIVLIGVMVMLSGFKKDKKDKSKKKKKKKKNPFSMGQDSSGQAMVEFIFVAITFLFTILGVMQLALILNAYALTRYAAYNAARAAIVHGANQEKMEEAARLSLVSIFPRHGRADHVRGVTENYLAAKATDSDPAYYTYTIRIDGSDQVRSAPITEVKVVDNRGVGSGEVVTFDDPVQAPKSLLTVEVTHRYQMVIPLVNRILFFVYNRFLSQKNSGSGGYDGESLMNLSAVTDRMRRTGGMGGEYRFPLTAHYTMRLQSDYERP